MSSSRDRGDRHYFGWQPTAEDAERFSKILPFERMHAVFDDGRIVAGAGAYPLELTLPPARCRAPASRSWASFLSPAPRPSPADDGFAAAGHPRARRARRGSGPPRRPSTAASVRARVARAARRGEAGADPHPPEPPREGGFRLIDHDEAMRVLPRIYEPIRKRTPGFVSRTPDWWEARRLSDRPESRRGPGRSCACALRADGRTRGLRALPDRAGRGDVRRGRRPFGSSRSWGSTRRRGGTSGASSSRSTGPTTSGPSSFPSTSRSCCSSTSSTSSACVYDGPWVRAVDVPAALEASAVADGRATIEITADPQFPENVGTWTVEAGAWSNAPHGGRTCGSTCRASDRRCSAGSRSRSSPAAAGRRRVPAAARARMRSSGPSALRGAQRPSDPPDASTLEGDDRRHRRERTCRRPRGSRARAARHPVSRRDPRRGSRPRPRRRRDRAHELRPARHARRCARAGRPRLHGLDARAARAAAPTASSVRRREAPAGRPIVYLSFLGADPSAAFLHARSHGETEAMLAERDPVHGRAERDVRRRDRHVVRRRGRITGPGATAQ